jgi:hypothetical protein
LEISGLSPYQMSQVSTDPEHPGSAAPEAAPGPGGAPAPEKAAGDRVELVRTQNLTSPMPEDLDLDQAALLLRQVSHRLNLMDRQDARQLYQFHRLRDLCCRLHGGAAA